ncbi:MAG: 2-dehydro-3-deoxygalactonokinase [Pseudomonadota bacterium]
MHEQLVGIDWGSSKRRAYLVDARGRCLAQAEDALGLLAACARAFGGAMRAARVAK